MSIRFYMRELQEYHVTHEITPEVLGFTYQIIMSG